MKSWSLFDECLFSLSYHELYKVVPENSAAYRYIYIAVLGHCSVQVSDVPIGMKCFAGTKEE